MLHSFSRVLGGHSAPPAAAWCRGGPSLSATGTPVFTQCGSLSLCSGWRYHWRPIVLGANRTIQRLHCVREMREYLPLSAQHFLVNLLGWRLSGYKTDWFLDQWLKSDTFALSKQVKSFTGRVVLILKLSWGSGLPSFLELVY